MLMEMYVIKEGIDVFHYSREEMHQDHFILSSGFLSAITNFLAEVRSSKIDFFSSESEIFIFEELDRDMLMVLIFQNTIDQNVARLVKRHLVDLVHDSKIMEQVAGIGLSTDEELRIREKVEALANNLLSVEYQVEAAEEFIRDGLVDYLLIYNYYQEKVYLQHGELSDTGSKDILNSLRKLPRIAIPLVKTVDIGKNFELISIESYEYHFVLAKYRTYFTIVLVEDPEDLSTVNNIPFKIMSLPGYSRFAAPYDRAKLKTAWKLSNDGTIDLHHGSFSSTIDQQSVTKLLEVISQILDCFGYDEYNNFTIYGDQKGYCKVTSYFTSGYQLLEIFK